MKQLIQHLLARIGYRIQGTRFTPRQLLDERQLRAFTLEDAVVRRMFEVGPALHFVQIGVFDGATKDPLAGFIKKHGWCGVLVEPQPDAVKALRVRYSGNGRIIVMQAALAAVPGPRTLFTVAAENAPSWAGGLASFDRSIILKHADQIPGLAGIIRDEVVDCIVFQSVLARLPSERLDLLQIDTEGGDAEILSLFPFDRVQPAIVHWEVKHMSLRQRESCLALLVAHGYRFSPSGDEDMLAVRF